MKKDIQPWSIRELSERFVTISFPEYQREPNLWSKAAKQRLIDSIVRDFDIASIYLYESEDGSLECIDGRQRLGAMMSFIDMNPEDSDNGFEFRRMNEIFVDEEEPYEDLEGRTYSEIRQRALAGDYASINFTKRLEDYSFTVVRLYGSRDPLEFNLQFTRLNLGTIINSGEKLHAMVGELRDVCFVELKDHPFLKATGIQSRRFAQEQVAAQIFGQVFSLMERGTYGRTRHFDLQYLFKEHTRLDNDHREAVERVKVILDLLNDAFADVGVLRSRAMTVSTVLLAWETEVSDSGHAKDLAMFMDEFSCRLKWQVGKKLDVDPPYRYLIDFQRHVTQASVEKRAVEERATILKREYDLWRESRELTGDSEYQGDAATECRASVSSNDG